MQAWNACKKYRLNEEKREKIELRNLCVYEQNLISGGRDFPGTCAQDWGKNSTPPTPLPFEATNFDLVPITRNFFDLSRMALPHISTPKINTGQLYNLFIFWILSVTERTLLAIFEPDSTVQNG